MNWTAERDGQLKELHAKRVSPAFIASWMRWPPSAVRARLIELGLAKPMSPKAASITAMAKASSLAAKSATAKASVPLRAIETLRDAFDEEEEIKTKPGCPRGHLLSEAKIAALYRTAGGTYR